LQDGRDFSLNLAPWPTQERESLDEAAMPSVLEALHCLRIAITVFDAAERLVFVNEHFNHLFGLLPPRDELIGLSYEQLIRLELAGGEIAGPSVPQDVGRFVAERRSQFTEGEYRPRDITLADGRIVEIKARRTANGGWIALWTDVTAARHVLGRLQDAIALSVDAFAFYDRGDKLLLCNDEYAAINGVDRPEDLIGRRFREVADRLIEHGRIVSAEDIGAWLERRLEAHRVPAGAMTVETASGTAYLLRDRATDDGGRVVVFTDVTEHHRVEKTLAEQTRTLDKTRRALAQSQAESSRQANYLADLTQKLDQAAAEADSTKTTLLRTMSHELKTPLNAIIGFSDLLASMADRVDPEQVKEYAGLIHQGGNNLLRLINQILDLTKISAGRYELCRTCVDAGSLLWLAKDAFAARVQKKSITIDADCCPVGLFVDGDEAALTTMTGQLIDNAVNFTQQGGLVRLSVSKAANTIKICVCDNGPGVPAGDLERILRPFEQGGRGTADHSGGAGLGLTLVKAFCELHGGALHIESAAGFAATIELPAAD
jgi:signal transduction histidine kinase